MNRKDHFIGFIGEKIYGIDRRSGLWWIPQLYEVQGKLVDIFKNMEASYRLWEGSRMMGGFRFHGEIKVCSPTYSK